MFKWWFLLVFLPTFRFDLMCLIIFISGIILFFGIWNIVICYENGLSDECLKKVEKTLEKSIIGFVILLIVASVFPTKKELIEVFVANTILTKENTELISKIPNKSLKYLDKIIQEKLNEGEK